MADREIPTGKMLQFAKFFYKKFHSIPTGHVLEGVRTNGSARRVGLSDAMDELDEKIKSKILHITEAVEDLNELNKCKDSVTEYMDKHGIVRCPDCLVGNISVTKKSDRNHYMDWDQRNSLGEPDGLNGYHDCDTCDGYGVVFRRKECLI